MQVTLNIENPHDWTLLLPLLERLGIGITTTALPVVKQRKRISAKELAHHKAIIEKGGDATYFGDAAEWQRAQREDFKDYM